MEGKTTRTLNPLHFEDLEPHRFEDLVRQLAFAFRTWRSIEATGRLGSDEGIDIRATEEVGRELGPGGEQTEEDAAPAAETRLWVMQCKREKRVGPADVRKIVKDAVPAGGDAPYGFVVAAACDFSKKTRDAFHAAAKARGVWEPHLWGKAELEDMLFLPSNDHLLFAYFNISLQVRRRSLQTQLRSRLATKRKLISVLGGIEEPEQTWVLLRDAREERYPSDKDIPDFAQRPRWKLYALHGHNPPDHLAIVFRHYYAYVDDDGEHWDALFGPYEAPSQISNDLLSIEAEAEAWRMREPYLSYWAEHVPKQNQGELKVFRFVHYDRILAVDEYGDALHRCPHLFIDFDQQHGPFDGRESAAVGFGGYSFRRYLRATEENRVRIFPEKIPEPPTPSAGPGADEDAQPIH